MPDGPWTVTVLPPAEKDLARLPANLRERIREAIDALLAGLQQPHIKKLKARENEWSRRVGDWRVIFTCDTQIRWIWIMRVLPRGAAYRD